MTTQHLRVFRLTENLVGFYDGRIPGQSFADQPNWVDDGALSLGICSYALIDGGEAIVYDTNVSIEHARRIRETLEGLGATKFTVVLSHWHLDHVAGTQAFADCEIVANAFTAELLTQHRAAIEDGSFEGPPAIAPLVLPTTTFDGRAEIGVGRLRLELVQFDIHSRDATVIHLPGERLLLAGDTVEDTVTYVAEPDGLERHLDELERMRGLGANRIFPNHGDAAAIESGGYPGTLISATRAYVRDLLRSRSEPELRKLDLKAFVGESLQAGWINYFEPYERVHQSNLAELAARESTEGR